MSNDDVDAVQHDDPALAAWFDALDERYEQRWFDLPNLLAIPHDLASQLWEFKLSDGTTPPLAITENPDRTDRAGTWVGTPRLAAFIEAQRKSRGH